MFKVQTFIRFRKIAERFVSDSEISEICRTSGPNSQAGQNLQFVRVAMSAPPTPDKLPRKKSWHESKHLRKRAAFLLGDASLVPTDVSFYVGQQRDVLIIRGHKLLFALVSPVFQAMLYGEMKEKNFVEIPDVTPSALQCIKTYAYSDSVDQVNVDNVMEVLAASKKYLISKLTRYCYTFIQSHITLVQGKAEKISDDIIRAQCVAEIRRNTGEVVKSKGFMDLPQDRLMELTSWNDLTIEEPLLYEAVKKWRTRHQDSEDASLEPKAKRRKSDELFRHIRFALFTPEQLATGPVEDGLFSEEGLRELYRHAFGAKELTIFKSDSRKAASSFRLEVRLKVCNNTKWHLVDTIQIVIWTDVAPHEAEVLREYTKENALFYFKHSVDDSATGKLRTLEYDRSIKHRAARQKPRIWAAEMSDDGDKAEIFWPTSGMVCLKLQRGVPVLTLVTWKNVELGGQEPENVFGKPCSFGPVVGKAVKGPAEHLSQVGTYTYDAIGDFDLEGKNRPWADSKALAYGLTFECDLLV